MRSKPRTVIVFSGNASTIENINYGMQYFAGLLFPKGTDLFMVDYPGSGINKHITPTLNNILNCVLNVYKKAVENAKRKGHELWVFTISIGMGVFSSILKDLEPDEHPYAVVCMNGLMSMRKTLVHINKGFNIFYPFVSTIFNTAKNVSNFLNQTPRPNVRIYWFASEGDRMIDIENVKTSIQRWKSIDPNYYKKRIFFFLDKTLDQKGYNPHNDIYLLFPWYKSKIESTSSSYFGPSSSIKRSGIALSRSSSNIQLSLSI